MTRQVVELREYESKAIPLRQDEARLLQDLAGSRLDVRLGGDGSDAFVVTAKGYIGALVTPHVEILITPKVDLRNVFLLLDVGLPSSAWSSAVFSFGEDRNLLAAMAAFFARTVDRAVAAGLLRSYRAERERLVAMRGRIDIVEQVRQPALVSPIACAYDDFTADIPENRLLKQAVTRLLRVPGVRPDTRRDLLRVLTRFEEVGDAYEDPDDLLRKPFNRLTKHYEPALCLARLILRNTSLRDRLGNADASAFLLDMPDLFQRWVTHRLRRALRGQLDVVGEPTEHLGIRRKVPMAPDLVFKRASHTVYVGDVKYKLASGGLAYASDHYQLLAYTTVLELAEGVLIYCQSEGTPPEKEIVVRSAGTRLWTYQLPLAGSPSDVERHVQSLASWIASRAAAGMPDPSP